MTMPPLSDRLGELPRISAEMALILACLAHRWDGRALPSSPAISPTPLVELVRFHRIAPFCGPVAQAIATTEPSAAQALNTLKQQVLLRSLALTAETCRLADASRNQDIPILVLKGAALSQQIHGSPAVRAFRDIDLYVPAGNAQQRFVTLLGDLGYDIDNPRHNVNAISFNHRINPFHVEVHSRLAPHEHLFPTQRFLCLAPTTHLSIGGTILPTLSTEAALAYTVFHGSKHLWNQLYWLVDLVSGALNPSTDLEFVLQLVDRMGITRQAQQTWSLADRLFDLPQLKMLAGKEPRRPGTAMGFTYVANTPPLTEIEVVRKLGRVAFLRWEMGLYSSVRARLAVLAVRLSPSESDRRLIKLPKWLSCLYLPIRIARVLSRR